TTIEAENYVKVAKGKGLSCGVPVPICPEDIEKCNKEYLCTYGTTGLDSNLSWLNNSFADEAKLRGYSCGIAVKPEIKKQICSQNAELCSDNELCSWAIRKQTDSVRFWSKLSKFYDFVQEAKRRGLSCGVKKETPAVKNKTCFSDPKLCNDNLLCNNAVEGTVNNPRWGRKPYFGKYVTEAKRRGLSCGVKKKKLIKNEMVRSIQKQLNRLGCDAGASDGVLGRKTLSALKRWKSVGGNYTPNKIDQRLRSSLFESSYKCSSAQTSSTTQAKSGLLSGTWDVTYSRCDNKRYRSILSLYSSKSNEYEAIYNVQNRIYKGKLNIAGDKYTIALKGPGGLVSGNGILNKTYTRAQGRDHMGCLFDATKR
ncbi:peptidoglycan-binding protein, partial [Amylibacter sp.]|nr:peptidoglycan-binding protein [Amylibacter sp.]